MIKTYPVNEVLEKAMNEYFRPIYDIYTGQSYLNLDSNAVEDFFFFLSLSCHSRVTMVFVVLFL